MEEAIAHWSRKESRVTFKERKFYSLVESVATWQWESQNVLEKHLHTQTSQEAYSIAAKDALITSNRIVKNTQIEH